MPIISDQVFVRINYSELFAHNLYVFPIERVYPVNRSQNVIDNVTTKHTQAAIIIGQRGVDYRSIEGSCMV